jgi:hypothetical protein
MVSPLVASKAHGGRVVYRLRGLCLASKLTLALAIDEKVRPLDTLTL